MRRTQHSEPQQHPQHQEPSLIPTTKVESGSARPRAGGWVWDAPGGLCAYRVLGPLAAAGRGHHLQLGVVGQVGEPPLQREVKHVPLKPATDHSPQLPGPAAPRPTCGGGKEPVSEQTALAWRQRRRGKPTGQTLPAPQGPAPITPASCHPGAGPRPPGPRQRSRGPQTAAEPGGQCWGRSETATPGSPSQALSPSARRCQCPMCVPRRTGTWQL